MLNERYGAVCWLIAYDWILRRFLLDDSFLPALNYLSTRVVGDEIALGEMSKNVEQQRKVVAELKDEVVVYRNMSGQRYAALEDAITQSTLLSHRRPQRLRATGQSSAKCRDTLRNRSDGERKMWIG